MENRSNRKGSTVASFFMVLFGTAVIVMGVLLYQKQEQLSDVKSEALTEQKKLSTEHQKDFMEIENNIRQILVHEDMIEQTVMNKNDLSKEKMKHHLQNEIALIEDLMAQNKERMAAMTDEISEKNKDFTQLESQMARMKKRLKTYKSRIEEIVSLNEQLNKDLAKANTENEKLVGDLEAKDAELMAQLTKLEENEYLLEEHKTTIQQLKKKTNSAYYTVGSFKELRDADVVEKSGGILGIGASKQIKNDFEKEQFVRIDKYNYTTIPVFSKKAELATNHDPSSYQWIETDGEVKWLEIKNPDLFWEQTKFLVVMTKEKRELDLTMND